MDLSGIISISGMSGLYKVVAQSKNGIIVESLIDKKRIPAYSSYKISGLEDISVFTYGEDVPLSVVFKNIFEKEKGGPAIDPKSSEAELRKYFGEVLPDFDKERVYTSDIKKLITWYNLLQKNDLLKPAEKEEKAKASKEEKAEGEKSKEKAKASKAASEKTAIKPKAKATSPKPAVQSGKAKRTSTIRKTGA